MAKRKRGGERKIWRKLEARGKGCLEPSVGGFKKKQATGNPTQRIKYGVTLLGPGETFIGGKKKGQLEVSGKRLI